MLMKLTTVQFVCQSKWFFLNSLILFSPSLIFLPWWKASLILKPFNSKIPKDELTNPFFDSFCFSTPQWVFWICYPGVNNINVLGELLRTQMQKVQKDWQLALSGSVQIKAARRTLMKLTHGWLNFAPYSQIHNMWRKQSVKNNP